MRTLDLVVKHSGRHYPNEMFPVTGAALSAQVTSNKWIPSPRPAPDAVVAVLNALFRLDGAGEFTGTSGVWGTSRYIELVVVTDNAADAVEIGTALIGGVEHTFTVTNQGA